MRLLAADSLAVFAQGLTMRFDKLTAVAGIDLEIHTGECFGFLGPNGAGKTTTMKMIYGRLPPTAGSLRVLGLDARQDMRRIQARIGVVFQEDNLDPDFSCLDNLVVYARYYGIPTHQARPRALDLLEFVQLTEKRDVSVERLSGGMKRRLVIARSLVNQPELLVLDEPTTGLDPQARHLVWGRLRELRSSGITLLLTTHYMDEASRLCDRLAVMDQGRILALGTPPDLIRRCAGAAVLELHGLPPSGLALAQDVAEPLSLATAQVGDELTCYLQEPAAARPILAQLAALDLGPWGHTERPATLEDVFLRLAGHRLREE